MIPAQADAAAPPQRMCDALAGYFARRPDVVCAYLFGSHATGGACAASDVDVAVLLGSTPDGALAPMVQIEDDLKRALPGERVDVVILNEASLRLRHEIVCTGCLVFERDLDARVDFEVATAMRYFDWQPVERQLDQAAVAWARRGQGP